MKKRFLTLSLAIIFFTIFRGNYAITKIDARVNCQDRSSVITPFNKDSLNKLDQSNGDINSAIGRVHTSLTDLPIVSLEGDMSEISHDNYAYIKVEYSSNELKFSCYGKTKWNGNSSLNYPKKNLNLKLYQEATCDNKYKVDVGWGNENKYCLKANYIDHSHARNIVSARIWAQIVKSRPDYDLLPEDLRNSPNQGAIDGYPIKLYINGKYEGIYTWNIPKDAWTFHMDDNLDTHCALCGENYQAGCFNAEAKCDGTDWSDKVHDTCPESIVDRWNEVIQFVRTSTDAEFKANLKDYIDVQSVIDYYIYMYFNCGLDGFGKNQIFLTYDGKLWYASAYDMDTTWGLYWNGTRFVPATYRCQEDYESCVTTQSHPLDGNQLYVRLAKLFPSEIQTRYNELRETVFSDSNLFTQFESFINKIPKDLYLEDLVVYSGIPSSSKNNMNQIKSFIIDRGSYVDGKMEELTKSTNIAIDGNDILRLVLFYLIASRHLLYI